MNIVRILWKIDCMQRTTNHIISGLSLVIALVMTLFVWLQAEPGDLWSRRWLLIIIPIISGLGLLISWRHVWQDVALGIAVTYFVTPLIAARVESCFLPIDGAIPCFADVNQVRVLADQLGHPMYYPGLILLHVIGVGVTWWYVSRKGGFDASARPTTA
jgi:predicted Na+-dependent transporter